MKRTIFSLVVVLLVLGAGSVIANAQTAKSADPQVEKDIELLRTDVRANKKKILAAGMPLTEEEGAQFWPVYDRYVADMMKHSDELYAIVKDYAANQNTMTDEKANSLVKRWGALQVEMAQTRQKYIPIIQKVLPGKKAALFFQLNNRLDAIIDIQVVSEIPLMIP